MGKSRATLKLPALKDKAVTKLLRSKDLAGRVDELEKNMLAMPQVPCGVVHSFAPGQYIRQVTLPANTVAIGHRQKTFHLNVMVKGRVTMIDADGSYYDVVAPLVFIGGPGRKVGFIREETVWLNIYATNEREIATLEETYLDKTPLSKEIQERIAVNRTEDVEDYQKLLGEIGMTDAQVRAETCRTDDLIEYPFGSFKVKVALSAIEGHGVVATSDILEGEPIAPALIGSGRTPAGRYTNHAKHPNAIMVRLPNGDITLIALRAIEGSRGGWDGEEITIDYREALKLSAQRSLQ